MRRRYTRWKNWLDETQQRLGLMSFWGLVLQPGLAHPDQQRGNLEPGDTLGGRIGWMKPNNAAFCGPSGTAGGLTHRHGPAACTPRLPEEQGAWRQNNGAWIGTV
eukprot:s934_g21.t1